MVEASGKIQKYNDRIKSAKIKTSTSRVICCLNYDLFLLIKNDLSVVSIMVIVVSYFKTQQILLEYNVFLLLVLKNAFTIKQFSNHSLF